MKFRTLHYKLLGKIVVPCDDALEWAVWLSTADRYVGRTTVGPMTVSTVFLGIDHGFGDKPQHFETMIFNGGDDSRLYQERCETWGQAEAMHATAVAWAQERLGEATASTELSHEYE